MIRTLISWLVLILIPAVSLGFAVVPYVWVKKKKQPVLWKHLWVAFFIGLVGNVAWWWVVDSITNDKIAIYLNGMIDSGIMFGFFFYSLFFLLTPFIFFKLKYSHSSKAQMAAVIGLTIVSIAIVAGVWILLFAIAIRGLMNTF